MRLSLLFPSRRLQQYLFLSFKISAYQGFLSEIYAGQGIIFLGVSRLCHPYFSFVFSPRFLSSNFPM